MTLRTFLKTEDIVSAEEILDDLYMQAMHDINNSYLEGTIKFIEKDHPDLDRQIDEVDRKIKGIWQLCIEGKSSLKDFINALDSYKNLYLQSIELYKSKIENEQMKEFGLLRK